MNSGGIFFLIIAILIASTFSAIFGLAGGAISFSALVWIVSVKVAIPVHSGLQSITNLARVVAYFKYINWKITLSYSILIIPGAYLGSLLFGYFKTEVLQILIGIFIIISVFISNDKQQPLKKYKFILLGFVSSFLGMIIAVTGPFIASYFNLNNIQKEELVGTKSACQGIAQVIKIIVFYSVLHFDFQEYLTLILLLGGVSILGTFIGKKILSKISNSVYKRLNTIILIVIGINMLIKSLIELL
ncbi:MAG: sulfite exporter TauE/SafE family protein [Cyclobacteriaceae bacterium]